MAFGLALAGGLLIGRQSAAEARVGGAVIPPPWSGSTGATVLLRGGALWVGLMIAIMSYGPTTLKILAMPLTYLPLLLLAALLLAQPAFAQDPSAAKPTFNPAPVVEQHQMIPMRDGLKLSAWLYFPPGDGPWPVLFEQRYADIRGDGTRRAATALASAGYVVAMVNYRGTWQSEEIGRAHV